MLTLDAQCVDVYNNPVDCPTMDDSIVLYNNAVKVVNFYERHPDYIKTSSEKILTPYDKLHIFQELADARRMFKTIRKLYPPLPGAPLKDFTYNEYYQEVDEYRFYQRELENQTLNREASASLYDLRISPVVINKYRCKNLSSVYSGDLVNIPLYIPVIVKPVMLLTDSELVLRNALLGITTVAPPNFIKYVPQIIQVDTLHPVKKPINEQPSLLEMQKVTAIDDKKYKFLSKYNTQSPVYYFEDPSLGGPALIGFMNDRVFVKIKKEDYTAFAVPIWAQKLLEDSERLNKFLNQLFGDYFQAIK
jgi:hypothetical protein